MIIAVDTRSLLPDTEKRYGAFIEETLRRITGQHPEHQFYFLFDRPYDKRFLFAANVTPLVVNPPVRHPLFWKWWYDVQIPRVLKKIKADVFLAPGGVCSLHTTVPQCLVVHDLLFLQQPQQFTVGQLWFYKRYTPRFLEKAAGLATVFSFLKNQLVTRYAIPEAKIRVVGQGLKDHFQPTTLEAQALVKEEY